jgi:hypothetical protein
MQVSHSRNEKKSAVIQIAECLAELEDIHPTELEITLGNYLPCVELDIVSQSDNIEPIRCSFDKYNVKIDDELVIVQKPD